MMARIVDAARLMAIVALAGCGGEGPAARAMDAAPVTDAEPVADASPAADAPLAVDAPERAAVEEAARNAARTQPLLVHGRRWLTDEMRRVDARSGLLMDLYAPAWSTRDTAADIYPFFTWSAYLLAPEVFQGEARRALAFERTHTTEAATGALPHSYDPGAGGRVVLGHFDLLFGAAEYAKDGLTPIIELTGDGAWRERMGEVVRDSFVHAAWRTPSGDLVPTEDLEVHGDHLQVLPRLAAMARGEAERDAYLALAERIADHYFVRGDYVPPILRDHGCEIVGGFALLYAVERQLGRAKADVYEPLLRRTLDGILCHGLTPEGMMHNETRPGPCGVAPARRGELSDNWGQNYVAFLIYAALARAPDAGGYALHADRALRSLSDPAFHDYPWQDTNIDGLADSMEGAIYLLASRPVPEGLRWLDAEARGLDARWWGPDKFGANATRTALLYARARTLGAWARPWREDVAWGAAWADPAAPRTSGVVVSVRAERPWRGRVAFDSPRHREIMGFASDYPRMNYLPEYFVAEPDARYRVRVLGTSRQEEVSGRSLVEGYPLELAAGAPVEILVERAP